MNQQKTKAFTLVELIVVITILAILGTIAFISLQGYSKDARDSVRLSDINNIKKSLELFSLQTGKYPMSDNPETVRYQGDDVWHQGTVGDNVISNLQKLNEKPVDPLFDTEYIYSVTDARKEYEVLALYEGDQVASNMLISQTYAADNLYPVIDGTYNQVYVQTANYVFPTPSIITSINMSGSGMELDATNIDSQVVSNGDNIPSIGGNEAQTGSLDINLSATGTITSNSTDEEKVSVIEAIQNAYTGTVLATQSTYAYILDQTTTDEMLNLANITVLDEATTSVASSGGGEGETPAVPLIDQAGCEGAGWIWVSDTLDNQGDGFCISPIFESAGDSTGLTWNDVGTQYGWTSINYATTEGAATNLTGVTAYLNTYTCDSLGTAGLVDFVGSDTIEGRMAWLTTVSNNKTELSAIDWINITTNNTAYAIPAVYIADCMDGVKDLTTDMTLGAEIITWSDYISTVDNLTTRDARNKYLLAWTNKSGGHIPSAYSNIGAQSTDLLTGTDRGEYQVACDAGLLGAVSLSGGQYIGADDDTSGEFIWTSAVGTVSDGSWGLSMRTLGREGCGLHTTVQTGSNGGNKAARFVVRP